MKQLNSEQLSLNRFSVLTAPYLHHTLEYGLDSIAANGFSGVELWGASPHYCIDDYTPEERSMRIREIRRMLKERGLTLTAFHPEQCRQYPINIASPIEYVRSCSMKVMEAYLEDTAALGTDKMILAPGWEYVDAQSEENFKRAVESIRTLDEKAKALGVKLFIEEMSATSTLFTPDLAHLSRLLGAVASDNVSPCLDTVMMDGNEETIDDYYKYFGTVGHVHFSDHNSAGCAAPGLGDAKLNEQLAALAVRGYSGTFTLTLWGASFYKDPDSALRQSIQWLRDIGISD